MKGIQYWVEFANHVYFYEAIDTGRVKCSDRNKDEAYRLCLKEIEHRRSNYKRPQ